MRVFENNSNFLTEYTYSYIIHGGFLKTLKQCKNYNNLSQKWSTTIYRKNSAYLKSLHISAVSNFCNLPVLTGEGNAQLQRYYYDTTTRTCRGFTYRGTKGNQNNFVSMVRLEIHFILTRIVSLTDILNIFNNTGTKHL